MNKNISYNIVTSFNEKYIKYGLSLIFSVWKNNLYENIIFTILDCGISLKSKKKNNKMVRRKWNKY